jgi:mRNA interferase YafQ
VKEPIYTTRFRREFALMLRRGKNEAIFEVVAARLLNGEPLAPRHQDHALKGSYLGWRDCHLQSDWVLIYKSTPTEIIFGRTGTHSDLF